jgi:hypothetical protein
MLEMSKYRWQPEALADVDTPFAICTATASIFDGVDVRDVGGAGRLYQYQTYFFVFAYAFADRGLAHVPSTSH